MLSKPNFEVDLIKPGGKTLSFTCSYVQEEDHPEGQEPDEEGEQTNCTSRRKNSTLIVFQMYLQSTR